MSEQSVDSYPLDDRSEKQYLELFDVHRADFHRFARSRMQDAHLAEDILQEAMLLGKKHFPKLLKIGKFKTWMNSIIFHLAIRSRRRKAYIQQEENFFDTQSAPETDGLTALLLEEHREMVHRSLAQLSDKERKVIYAYYFRDLSYAEMRQEMHIPLGTVKIHLLRAKEKFRTKMRPYWKNGDLGDLASA